MAIRVFVVDDEAPARAKIVRFLRQDPEVTIAGEAASGEEAATGIERTTPDLIFLDIQMPGMDGFELIRALKPPVPRIVFVTAYDQYAIQAFDVHAFGYLLKPFDQARFTRVLEDAKRELARNAGRDLSAGLEQLLAEIQERRRQPQRLLIQQSERAFFLPVVKIDWVESERNYLNIHSGERTYTIRGTIDGLEERLGPEQFLRLNRSNLVRIDFIRELQNWFHGEYKVVLQSGTTLTWTRRYLNRHPELLGKS